MCAGKDGCGAKQLNHRLFFQLSCFDQLPCAFFFNCWSEAFGVAYVPRPQTKSACTPFQPCARLRWQGLRGRCIRAMALRGRWVLFQRLPTFIGGDGVRSNLREGLAGSHRGISVCSSRCCGQQSIVPPVSVCLLSSWPIPNS